MTGRLPEDNRSHIVLKQGGLLAYLGAGGHCFVLERQRLSVSRAGRGPSCARQWKLGCWNRACGRQEQIALVVEQEQSLKWALCLGSSQIAIKDCPPCRSRTEMKDHEAGAQVPWLATC